MLIQENVFPKKTQWNVIVIRFYHLTLSQFLMALFEYLIVMQFPLKMYILYYSTKGGRQTLVNIQQSKSQIMSRYPKSAYNAKGGKLKTQDLLYLCIYLCIYLLCIKVLVCLFVCWGVGVFVCVCLLTHLDANIFHSPYQYINKC